jgi:hypothetical protein
VPIMMWPAAIQRTHNAHHSAIFMTRA